MAVWHFVRDQKKRGPFTDVQLRALAKTGQLRPDDMVLKEGTSKWLPAAQVKGLFRDARSSGPVLVSRPAYPTGASASAPRPASKPPGADAPVTFEIAMDDPPAPAPRGRGLSKPALFALCGAAGAFLFAVVFGEAAWATLRPGTLQQTREVRVAAPELVQVYAGGTNRFALRVARTGFKGTVEASAGATPDGVEIDAITLAERDTEAMLEVRVAPTTRPGRYDLRVNAWGTAAKDEGEIMAGQAALTLEVKRPPASLRIASSAQASVHQGGSAKVTLRLARAHFDGPVEVVLGGLPSETSAPRVTIPAHANEAEVTISASRTAPPGIHRLVVNAEGTDRDDATRVTATSAMGLEVLARPRPQVDFLFVLDVTGSMQAQINGVRNGINRFVESLSARDLDARFGLIAFRDVEEDNERPYPLTFGGSAFTTDVNAFQQSVQTLKASGGGITNEESSVQGLDVASKQDFRPNAARVLFLVTDNPPHIHVSEYPNTIQQVTPLMEQRKIQQVHVMTTDFSRFAYQPLLDKFKGSYFELRDRSETAFLSILPKLGEEIARITVASLPAAPTAKADLPALLAAGATAELPSAPPVAGVQAVQASESFAEQDRSRLVFAIAVWTGLIGAGVSLSILAGQEYYLRGFRVPLRPALLSLAGGAAAGLVGGAAGQAFFLATPGGAVWGALGRLASWTLIGALIGWGISHIVPNMQRQRGLLGGACGGVAGALAFLAVGPLLGETLGRLGGAALLGFFIGLTVAIAETAFRRYWLEVTFGKREVRTVTLGAAPVTIGSDERQAAIFVQGAAPIAFRFRVDGDQVVCEDYVQRRSEPIDPGEARPVAGAIVRLCSAASAKETGFVLRFANGETPLREGMPLTADDLPGLEPNGEDGAVALVARHPGDPNRLLLRNRSKQIWAMRDSQGKDSAVGPSNSVPLAEGVAVNFGAAVATIARRAAPARV